jgi:uncharacterized membrane protein HdeD (DUF308 family)
MSDTANVGTLILGRADQRLEPLRVKWGWIVALGAVFLVAGFVALGSVITATVVSVTVVGAMMLVSGVAEIINAFSVKTWGKFLLWALLGALYVIAGIVTVRNPLLAATVLTLILGIDLIVSGFLRIFLAIQMAQGTPWAWVALSGVVTLLVGGMILAQWPVSSLFMLGILLGVDLMFAGVGWISMGLALKRQSRTKPA